MRIAIFADGVYPYVIGGMQKHSYCLARYMAQAGAKVSLYYAAPEETEGEEDIFTFDGRCRVQTVRVFRPDLPYFPSHYLRQSYLVSERLLNAYSRNEEVDFIYAQGFTGWRSLLEKKKGLRLPPIGINQHGLEMYQKAVTVRSYLEQRMYRPFVTSQLRQADVALCLGGGLRRIIESLGVCRSRIAESPNGVGQEWLAPEVEQSGPLRFLFIGRYERRKGIEELHRAIRKMLGSKDFSMHFVGPIPKYLQVQSPQVVYWDLVKQEDEVRSIVQQSDVLVCPSYSEGMPTVILEAMASGLAVIATRVGAVDALVSEENGWLIPPGDPEALYHAMAEAIALPDAEMLKKKMSSRAKVAHRYLWPAVAQQTLRNIEAVLHAHPTPAHPCAPTK